MKQTTSFTVLVLAFLASFMPLKPATAQSQKKCDKAAQTMKACADMGYIAGISNEPREKTKRQKHVRVKKHPHLGSGDPISVYRDLRENYVFTSSTTDEDGDTTTTVATITPKGDTSWSEITGIDTLRWETTLETDITPAGDTVTKKVTRDGEQTTVEKTVIRKCAVPVPTVVQTAPLPIPITLKDTTITKMFRISDSFKIAYIGTPAGKFLRETSDTTNSPPYVVSIFKKESGIRTIEVVVKKSPLKRNGKNHYDYWLVIKGRYSHLKLFIELIEEFGRLKDDAPHG